METTIVENTLTDGSKTYDVVFLDGSNRVVISCYTKRGAERIEAVLAAEALHGEVH
jgi:hypothetical protein